MDESIRTATGAAMLATEGLDRLESQTMGLVDGYFSPYKYGPHVRSRAGMLAIESYRKGFEAGRQIAELAQELVRITDNDQRT